MVDLKLKDIGLIQFKDYCDKSKEGLKAIIEAVNVFVKITNTNIKDIYIADSFGYLEIIYFDDKVFYLVNPRLSNVDYNKYLKNLEIDNTTKTNKINEDKKKESPKTGNEKHKITSLEGLMTKSVTETVIREFTKIKLEFEKLLEGKNFNLGIFLNIDKKFIPFMFNYYYKYMNIDKKFDAFIELNKIVDNMSKIVPEDILNEIIINVPTRVVKEINEIGEFDQNGYAKVYRGEQSLSQTLDKAISWTTNKHIAEFFSNRFEIDGRIYTGRVHKDNILYIYKDDGECEILVRPGMVEDIEIIK